MKPKRLALSAEKEENPATEAETLRMAGGSGVFQGAVGGLAWLCGATRIAVAHLLTSEACLQYPLNPRASQAGLLDTKKARSQRGSLDLENNN